MLKTILQRAFQVMMRKPVKLWALSLLNGLLSGVAYCLFGPVIGLAVAATMLLNTSMTMIFLHGYRGEDIHTVQLFDCFRDWNTIKRVLCGLGWRLLWVTLWALIPVVGWVFAIIRGYEYALTPYILVLEPDISITEAIKISKERTKGWKGKMFWADVIMAACILVLSLLALIPYIGWLFGIVCFLACILMPLYQGLVASAFYEEITNPTPVVEAAASEPSAFCPHCGGKTTPDAMFCPSCGKQIRF